jgi:hypothetical protein
MEFIEKIKARSQRRARGEYRTYERVRPGLCFLQDDLSVANASGATVRADINSQLQSLGTLMSGTAAPSTTYAHMLWADTTNNLLKKRNAANSGWLVIRTLDETFTVARSSNTILAGSDIGKFFKATGTFTQTLTAAATLLDGWFCWYRNNGTGVITIDPNSSELIDGAATIDIYPGECVLIQCDATGFLTAGRILNSTVAGILMRPPLNVNPNWLIDQINEGSLYTVNTTGVQGPDGWTGNATGAGVFKLRTLADPDNAALKCLEISCTTADASIASTDKYEIFTALEGYDVAHLKSGTAAPGSINIRFKLKSNSVTGVMGVAIQNSAQARRYIGTITVPDTNENEYNVTLALDTTGTWLYTNGVGLYLFLTLAAGSNFQASAGAWGAGAERTTSGQANFMSANTNIVYLKRIHVQDSAIPLAYAPQDYHRELSKAQRYQEKSWFQGTAVGTATGTGLITAFSIDVTSLYTNGLTPLTVRKRAAPTVTLYSPNTGASGKVYDSNAPGDATPGTPTAAEGWFMFNAPGALGATNHSIQWHFTANARLS